MTAPPEEVAAEGRRWLRFAEEDLVLAQRDLDDPQAVPRGACLHAQQAAEKAIKAALVLLGIDPPTIHNLEALRRRLPSDWTARARPPDLARLTALVIESRYAEERACVSPRKKLIEVALPLEAINRESAREKSRVREPRVSA